MLGINVFDTYSFEELNLLQITRPQKQMDTYQRNTIIGVLDTRTNLTRNQRASWIVSSVNEYDVKSNNHHRKIL